MIDFTADLINTRDIIERIEELESDHTDSDGDMIPVGAWPHVDDKEWCGLTAIIGEIGDEARHGVTLIHENYFTDYIRDWYADTWGGDWTKEDPRTFKRSPVTWDDIVSQLPFSCIDWERVAEECRSDYTSIDIDGSTYYYLA